MSVTIIDTINNLDVTDDTIVTLKYEDDHEGWHSTGELESEAVREKMQKKRLIMQLCVYLI